MKKNILVFLLAAVLCLVCVACNDSNDNKYAKYDTLIQYLESGEYEQAQKELDKLTGQQSNGDTTDEGTVDENAQEKAAILGEWKSPAEGSSITFYADGTGVETFTSENGKLTWKYDGALACYVAAIHAVNMVISGTIQEENGLTYFTVDDTKLYHSDCYEKAVEVEYQKAYASCMENYASYTKAELRQAFRNHDNTCTLTYTGAFKQDGKVRITAFFRNNTAEDFYYNPDIMFSASARIIHDGAQNQHIWDLFFLPVGLDYDTYEGAIIPAGETVELVAVIDKAIDDIRFCGLSFEIFSPPMTYEYYWIDLTEQLK